MRTTPCLVGLLLGVSLGAQAAVAQQPANTAQAAPRFILPAPADPDAGCFIATATGARRVAEDRAANAEARQVGTALAGTASYFAGRLSTRLTGDRLRQALTSTASVLQRAERANVGRFAMGCVADFEAYMIVVADSSRRR